MDTYAGSRLPRYSVGEHSRRWFLTASSVFPTLFGAAHARNLLAPRLPDFPFSEYFEYELSLEIDGRLYVLRNGARLVGGFHTIYTDPYQYSWWPAPASCKLPTGETVIAAPPSIAPGMRDFLDAAGKKRGRGLNFEPKTMVTGVAAQYPVGAVPFVYILNDASRPAKIEGYVMRVALTSGLTRVRLLDMKINHVKSDMRKAISADVPWLAPVEEFTSLRDKRYSPYSAQWKAALKKWQDSLQPNAMEYSPRDALIANCAEVYPRIDLPPKSPLNVAAIERVQLTALREALLRGENCTLPLRLEVDDAGARFAAVRNPYVWEFAVWNNLDTGPGGSLGAAVKRARSADILGASYTAVDQQDRWASAEPSLYVSVKTLSMLKLASLGFAANDGPSFGVFGNNAFCHLSSDSAGMRYPSQRPNEG